MLFDDSFGVGEPLNETAFGTGLVIRGKHRDRAREIVKSKYVQILIKGWHSANCMYKVHPKSK